MAEWKTETITLLHPIKVGELSINSITLYEPDLEALEKIDDCGFQDSDRVTVRQSRVAIEALSRQPTEVIQRLHRDDFAAIAEKAIPLLGGSTEPEDGSASTAQTSGTSPAT